VQSKLGEQLHRTMPRMYTTKDYFALYLLVLRLANLIAILVTLLPCTFCTDFYFSLNAL
jgi:hypothetical protein